MQNIWLLILGLIYFLLVLIAQIYYIAASIRRKDVISDSFIRSLPEEPFVSIIVPTYNEENNIVTCLKSLRALNYSNFEIILSDGGSQDRTVELAKPYADQILIENEVPEGWIGKNRGCHLGFAKAKGDILLFTDADTEHTPDSLRITVSMLLEKKAGLLSLLPYQKVEKWWESIVPINFFISHLVSGGIDKVYQGNKGILQVWKAEGAVDGNGDRNMVLKIDRVDEPTGAVPRDGFRIQVPPRRYKHPWHNNPTSLDPLKEVIVMFDEYYYGEAIADNTGYSDIHPSRLSQP